MADSKITALASISTSTDPAVDPLVIVDVSDTSMAATGTTKKVTLNNLLSSSPTATGAFSVTGLVTAGSATITGAATVGTTLGVTGVSTFAAGTALLPALTTTGDTNTGIYYPAADTFAVTTGGTERYRVDSTGLGIGGSAASKLSITDTSPRINFVTTAGLDVTGYIYNAIDVGSGGKLVFGTKRNGDTALDRLTIDASGNVGIATGNVVMGTAAKGIDFSATASGSGTMTSELLNDYEEGTWTGTLTGGTTNPTIPVTATGRYTKIGRVVTVQITFTNVNTLGASGLLGITGLPFTNNASVNSVGSVNFYNIATFTGSPFVALGASQSSLVCYSNISNSAFVDVTHNASLAGNYLTAAITYTV